MRFIVYGAGAIGSLIGGCLKKHGFDAILVGRKKHVDEIRRAGLSVNGVSGKYKIAINAATSLVAIGPRSGDIVILCVKSYDVKPALRKLAKTFSPDTPVFCVQNGVRNEAEASKFFNNVYGIVAYFAAEYAKAGGIIHTADNRVAIGRYPSGIDSLAKAVCAAFAKAGFDAKTDNDIMGVKWQKLLLNLNSAALTVLNKSYQEALNDKNDRKYMASVLHEGRAILDKAKIRYHSPFFTLEDVMKGIECGKNLPFSSFQNRPSMWQDFRFGRRTSEIDFLNGEITKLGNRLGTKATLNSQLCSAIKSMFRCGKRPKAWKVLP